MDTFENGMGQCTLDNTFFRCYQLHVLGTDDYVDGFVFSETGIHTVKAGTKDLYQTISDHGCTDNVTVTDEVGNESVLRLVVDTFGSADLLDIALVHDHDGIGHGQSLLLVVGDIDKGNSQLIFQTDQFVLHVLTQFQIQCTQRLIQQQKLGLIYDSTGNGDTLLLTAA